MESVLFATAILAILYTLVWSLRNDEADSISKQTGLLRMREPPPVAEP